MNDNDGFEGEFKDLLIDFIGHKRALGYKYITTSKILRRFSVFTRSFSTEDKVLSKEIVTA